MALACQLTFGGFFVAGHLISRGRIHQCSKRRHLDDLTQTSVLSTAAEHHVHDAKTSPDDEGSPEQRLDLFRCGVGGHVEVLRAKSQQQIAHCTTHDIGLVTGIDQRLHDLHSTLIDQGRVNLVLGLGHLDTLAMRVLGACRSSRLAHQLIEEFLDHANNFRVRQPR